MFYDTGGRIGELIENSNYGDLKQDSRGMYIRVRSKTGETPEETTRKSVIQVLDEFGISATELKIMAYQN